MVAFSLLFCRFAVPLSLLLLIGTWAAQAQQLAPFRCGTLDQTPAQRTALRQLDGTTLGRAATGAVTYVPLRLHIVRRADGTGGGNEALLYQTIAETNRLFIAANLQLYVCGGVDYVNNSAWYDRSGPTWNVLNSPPNYMVNQIDVYYVNSLTIAGNAYGGLAYLAGTAGAVQRTLFLVTNSTAVLAHETGHILGLAHTFQGNDSANPADRELVARTNCTTAGDLICDTPADPFGLPGATAAACAYTGTAVDAQGSAYAPAIRNNMSYWSCGTEYTPGQYARMAAVLATLTTLSCTAAAAAAPTGLAATSNGGCLDRVQLSWQNHATTPTALGYFIERAVGGGDFAAVSAVGAGATTFTDDGAPSNTAVQYRIKPINAASGFSNVVSVQTGRQYCPVAYSSASTCATSTGGAGIGGVTLRQGTTTVFTWTATVCGPTYSVLPAQSVRLLPGMAYTLEVRLFTFNQGVFYIQQVGAWLDFNQNGSFADAGEWVLQSPPTGPPVAAFTASFSVPAGTPTGCGALRVRTEASGGLVTDPCMALNWGETQDRPVLFGAVTAAAVPAVAMGLTLTPNPAAGLVTVHRPGTGLVGGESIRLLDVQGREVRRVALAAGATECTVSLTSLSPGLYLVRLGGAMARLVVE